MGEDRDHGEYANRSRMDIQYLRGGEFPAVYFTQQGDTHPIALEQPER